MLLVNKRAQIGPLLGIGGVNGIFGLPLVVDDEASRVKSARVEPAGLIELTVLFNEAAPVESTAVMVFITWL